jgi:tetratricopeptide (TPR) repeat protein
MLKHPHLPSAPGRRNPGDEALERAFVALQMQRPGEAERLAASVLKANRGNMLAASLLGRALMAMNRADEAVEPLERAARRTSNPEIETLLGAALAAVGRRDEALDRLRQAITRRPPFQSAFREYADQLAKMGRFEEAVAVAEGGLRLMPDAVDLRKDLALLYLGRNDRAKARAMLLEALQSAPGRQDIRNSLALVMQYDGEYAPAADIYRHALGLRPDDALSRLSLGMCQLELGERDAGEASMRAATQGRPDMLGRTIYSLTAASHGRFFFRPSAVMKFLGG